MLVDRFGERPFLIAGPLLQFAGMGWIALIAEPGMSYGELITAAHGRRRGHLDVVPRGAELGDQRGAA